MGKTPAFQFYPGDWLRSEVAGCSIGAQGLWLRLLIVMHDCERYGYASQNGKPMSNAALARRCGVGLEEFNDLLAELEDAGVFSREEDDTIFSRRMARDKIEREQLRNSASITTTQWKEIRKQILLRDDFTCVYCGGSANSVDHVIPRSRGGNNDPENLVAACTFCNSSKKDRTPDEAGMSFIH